MFAKFKIIEYGYIYLSLRRQSVSLTNTIDFLGHVMFNLVKRVLIEQKSLIFKLRSRSLVCQMVQLNGLMQIRVMAL